MHYENANELFLTNVSSWHHAGFRGQHVDIVSIEEANMAHFEFKGRVKNPFGETESKDQHGQFVFQSILEFAPECTIHMVPNSYSSRSGRPIEDDMVDKVFPFIKENNIPIFTSSRQGSKMTHPGGKKQREILKQFIDHHGLTCITAAGNDREIFGSEDAFKDVFLGNPDLINVGAVHLQQDDTDKLDEWEVNKASYTNKGDGIDVLMVSNLMLSSFDSSKRKHTGTSFAAPALTGIIALIQSYARVKIGRFLWQDEILNIIKDNMHKINRGVDDFREEVGLFILPEFKEFDIFKYLVEGRDKKFPDTQEFNDKAATRMANLGLLKGYPDGTFKPNNKLSRSDMSLVVCRLLDMFYNI